MKTYTMLRCFACLVVALLGQICFAQTTQFPIGKILDRKIVGCQLNSASTYTDARIEVDGYHSVLVLRCKENPFIVISRLADVEKNTFEITRSYRLPKLRKSQSIWDTDCTFLSDTTIWAFAIGAPSKWGVGARLSKKTYAAILVPKSMEIVEVKPSQVSCGYQEDRD
jgi:hypothetical protein